MNTRSGEKKRTGSKRKTSKVHTAGSNNLLTNSPINSGLDRDNVNAAAGRLANINSYEDSSTQMVHGKSKFDRKPMSGASPNIQI